MRVILIWLAAVALAWLLVACGGNDEETITPDASNCWTHHTHEECAK